MHHLREAQELARRERTTLKELIETGLRTVVAQRTSEDNFVLADASVGGNGLQPLHDRTWLLLFESRITRSPSDTVCLWYADKYAAPVE